MSRTQQELCQWWFAMGDSLSHLTEDFLRLRFCPSKLKARRATAEALCLLADFSANTRNCSFTSEEAVKASTFITFMINVYLELSKVQSEAIDLSTELFIQLLLCGKFRH